MKRAALGFRMHSGWGVLVAVSGDANSLDVIDRSRMVTMDSKIPGSKQPYHYAASLTLPDAEKHLAKCASASERLSLAAVGNFVRELRARHFEIVGAAVLLASGRPLPPLSAILASHPLLHTAEGQFFRNCVRKSCAQSKISVTTIKEKELDERADAAFGKMANRVRRRISTLGRALGPPWTKDHKTAALAASMLLTTNKTLAPRTPAK
jgi:hypothetical protein